MTDKKTSHSTRLPNNANLVAGYKSAWLVALLAGIAFSLPASAKMYKWVDDKGVTHYGETIPPEYAGKDRAELNKAGRVIKKEEVLTAEQRRVKEQAEASKRDADEMALEAKRHDKALVNTYSNTKEIDLARSRNLQQVDARIHSTRTQLKMVSDSLSGLQNDVDARTKAGKKVPPSLHDDIQETQARLNKLQQDLDKATAEKAALEVRYDADKARYKELTGK